MKPTFTLPSCARLLCTSPIAYLTQVAFLLILTFFSFNLFAGTLDDNGYGYTSPFGNPTGTGSMRANLYLLNPSNNATILADGVLAEYNHLYKDSVTIEDAYKLTNIRENFGISRYNKTLAVERRPIITSTDTLFFKLWKTTQRHYQLEFVATNLFHPGMEAFLQDNYLGTNVSLSLTGTTKVNFSVNGNKQSSDIQRFRIIYKTSYIAAPLPVTFTNVKAQAVGKKMSIEWKVENEINIVAYEVERAANGNDFKTVSTVRVSGTNNAFNTYTSIDAQPLSGTNFYRIKSIDKDGQGKYSSIVKLAGVKMEKGTISIFPNPVTGNKINLQFNDQQPGIYHVRLYNNNGQMVYSTKLSTTTSHTTQSIYPNGGLRGGIYQVEIVRPDNTTMNVKAMMQ